MRKITILIVLFTTYLCNISAQGIRAYRKDGSVIDFRYSELDSLVAYPYKEPQDTEDYEFVDLGLSVKWATRNIGAETPEEAGQFFAWGEIEGYYKEENHVFSWENYKWCRGKEDLLTKYCTSTKYGLVDDLILLQPEDDAASVIMGGSWRIPSEAEWRELYSNCSRTWTEKNGVKGNIFVSRVNGNSIFIPSIRIKYKVTDIGEYWTNRIDKSYNSNAYYLEIDDDSFWFPSLSRCDGHTIRAVCE